MRFEGGETAARARVRGWIWDRDCLKDYFNTRNGMLGADYRYVTNAKKMGGCSFYFSGLEGLEVRRFGLWGLGIRVDERSPPFDSKPSNKN